MALYSQPLIWIALALVAILKFAFIWLTLVGMFYSLLVDGEGWFGCWAEDGETARGWRDKREGQGTRRERMGKEK